MNTLNILSYDVGGSGGKVQLGRFDGERLTSETVSRCLNSTVNLLGEQYWDFLNMVQLRDDGVARAAAMVSGEIAAVGTTVFGNSFVFLDQQGRPFSLAYGVYPKRVDPALEEVGRRIPLRQMHFQTGAEIRNYITACQLMAYRVHGEEDLLDRAHRIVLFPDALNYTLSGEIQAEITAASVGGMYNPATRAWDGEILCALALPAEKLPPITEPLTIQGQMSPDVCARLGIAPGAKVVNAAGHDTASAVYALPAMNDTMFLSLGTMALIGCEVDHVIANEQSFAARLACCAAPDGQNVLVSAIRCMWHLEKCRTYYAARGEAMDYDRIIEWVRGEPEMERIIDLDDDDYLMHSHDLPRIIAEYCARTGQKPITRKSELFRCLFGSVAWAVAREYAVISEIFGAETRSGLRTGRRRAQRVFDAAAGGCVGMRDARASVRGDFLRCTVGAAGGTGRAEG